MSLELYTAIVTSPLYWISLLVLFFTVCYGWYWYGVSCAPRPARVKPPCFLRRFMIFLPRLVLAGQIAMNDQVNAASFTVLWV